MKNEMADDNNVVEKIADRVGWERSGRARFLSFRYPAVSVSVGIGNTSGIWVRSSCRCIYLLCTAVAGGDIAFSGP